MNNESFASAKDKIINNLKKTENLSLDQIINKLLNKRN